jgi:hypothetical protein
MAQEHMLFSSAGFILFHSDLGTTPNMAPPSSLKLPAWMLYIFIKWNEQLNVEE